MATNNDSKQTLTIEAGKVYRDGWGRRAHIMGPARRTDVPGAMYSLEANHYTPDGRLILPADAPAESLRNLVEEIGTFSDGGKGEGWAHHVCSVCYPTASDLAD